MLMQAITLKQKTLTLDLWQMILMFLLTIMDSDILILRKYIVSLVNVVSKLFKTYPLVSVVKCFFIQWSDYGF